MLRGIDGCIRRSRLDAFTRETQTPSDRRFPSCRARTNREAGQNAGLGEFACRLIRWMVEVIKVEVRLVYGSEWGKVGVAEVSFDRGPGRRSRTERTVSFLRTIEGGGKGGESNWTGINDLPIKCSEW